MGNFLPQKTSALLAKEGIYRNNSPILAQQILTDRKLSPHLTSYPNNGIVNQWGLYL